MRLPGGNFISAYDWQDTIGDPDKTTADYGPGLACGAAQ